MTCNFQPSLCSLALNTMLPYSLFPLQLGVAAYLAFGLDEPIYAAVLLGLILPQASTSAAAVLLAAGRTALMGNDCARIGGAYKLQH